jgi:choline dehydrogenase
MTQQTERTEFDYIVVGSGAGGGPVACNLAKAGYSVLILEAGGEEEGPTYQVPAFHALSTEDRDLAWEFFVQHYEDPARQQRDSKYSKEHGGVFYPRAGTLGGCTAHNAMITVYPHNSDWDRLAELTGDDSWRAENMRRYFQRMERCEYLLAPGEYPKEWWRKALLFLLRGFGTAPRRNPTRHGFDGWLQTEQADPLLAVGDGQLLEIVKEAAEAAGTLALTGKGGLLSSLRKVFESIWRRESVIDSVKSLVDPNDWRNNKVSAEGVVLVPLATKNGQRNGTREYIRAVQQDARYQLTVRTRALAARVLLNDQKRAIGVEYLEGANLYRASPKAPRQGTGGTPRQVFARREVILSGGSFNTPQLLMLSGIGPAEELKRHGLPVAVDLPGVGRNLQDRYEVGVITELKEDFKILGDATFKADDPNDPAMKQWREKRTGLYTSNGAVLGIVKRSKPERPEPDLFIFGLPGYFKGYFPGYSNYLETRKTRFTWAILKAHTHNTAGFVKLRTTDPRDTPDINFKYFDEGNDSSGEDLESVVEGVKFVRQMSTRVDIMGKSELLPSAEVSTDEQLKTFIKDEAWGHHACGTCKIGKDSDPMAVLNSRFQVRGVQGLRVVDASVFPHIPGFFIVTPIYMISEKASDVILEDAKRLEGADNVRLLPAPAETVAPPAKVAGA